MPDTSTKVVVTQSKPSAFPSSLRSKRSEVQQVTEDDIPAEATTRQTCDKCGRTEMRFYTQQLRSADEGTTVFYMCECGNKYVVFVFVRTSTLTTISDGPRTIESLIHTFRGPKFYLPSRYFQRLQCLSITL